MEKREIVGSVGQEEWKAASNARRGGKCASLQAVTEEFHAGPALSYLTQHTCVSNHAATPMSATLAREGQGLAVDHHAFHEDAKPGDLTGH